MISDRNDRYAVSLYVDLRLGLIGRDDKMYTNDEAHARVSRIYGKDAANYAERVAD